MTTHELARELLKGADLPAVVFAREDAYEVAGLEVDEVVFNGSADTKEVQRDEHGYIRPRKCVLFEICNDVPPSDEMKAKAEKERADQIARTEEDRAKLSPRAFGLKYASITPITPEMMADMAKQEFRGAEL